MDLESNPFTRSLYFLGLAFPAPLGLYDFDPRGVPPHVAHGATDMKDQGKKPLRAPRAAAEDKLDEEIEELFPASDPPANTPTCVGSPPRPQAKRATKGKQGRRG